MENNLLSMGSQEKAFTLDWPTRFGRSSRAVSLRARFASRRQWSRQRKGGTPALGS